MRYAVYRDVVKSTNKHNRDGPLEIFNKVVSHHSRAGISLYKYSYFQKCNSANYINYGPVCIVDSPVCDTEDKLS
jgi:hypothetical protein